jgi:hypothetical protein
LSATATAYWSGAWLSAYRTGKWSCMYDQIASNKKLGQLYLLRIAMFDIVLPCSLCDIYTVYSSITGSDDFIGF